MDKFYNIRYWFKHGIIEVKVGSDEHAWVERGGTLWVKNTEKNYLRRCYKKKDWAATEEEAKARVRELLAKRIDYTSRLLARLQDKVKDYA